MCDGDFCPPDHSSVLFVWLKMFTQTSESFLWFPCEPAAHCMVYSASLLRFVNAFILLSEARGTP